METQKTNINYEVELNFFYMHYNDAVTFHKLAKLEKTKLKSLYARHSILSVVFSLEALINRVYAELYIGNVPIEQIDKLETFNKWLIAPFLCGKDNKTIGKGFDKSREPFQSFKELLAIRNFLVHPKADKFIPAIKQDATITILETKQEVPWFETLKGKKWPQTKIPLNPFEIDETHSEKAITILDSMKDYLLSLFKDIIDFSWLFTLDVRLERSKEGEERILIQSLWGGYTPERKED